MTSPSQNAAIEIVDFAPEHAAAFKALNEAWIARHFVLEAKDREVLDDPQGEILAKGGRIFMALDAGRPVGCVAMILMPDRGYEVAKMTVAEDLRGSGLGRRLMQACIDEGVRLGAPRLYLETNSSLAPALGLYRAMGFQDLAPVPTPYVRADVFMERKLP
ncbi:MAG: GNAT family N-acetyltransferase [Alphaproteobacteria bacterium]|nr:GNAT family N-acetyltransferase [Alphaproteobacteria bacterium]